MFTDVSGGVPLKPTPNKNMVKEPPVVSILEIARNHR